MLASHELSQAMDLPSQMAYQMASHLLYPSLLASHLLLASVVEAHQEGREQLVELLVGETEVHLECQVL